MPENDTRVWLDLKAAELTVGHAGSTLRVNYGENVVQGRLGMLGGIHHDGHLHIHAALELDEERLAQIELDGDDEVQLLVGGES